MATVAAASTLDGIVLESYPLSPLQQGMLFQSLVAPRAGVDVEQVVCRTREPLDGARLHQAWIRVVERNPVLRTRFRWEHEAEPLQEVMDAARLEFAARGRELEDAAGLARFLDEDRARGFDLAHGPAMRLAVLGLRGGEQAVVWTFHHILLDGHSVGRLLGEVFDLYDGAGDADVPERPAFRDHVAWLRGRDPAVDQAYWAGVLSGMAEPAPLRPIRLAPRDPGAEPPFGERELPLSPAATAAVRAFEAEQGVWLNTLVQGAWALLLGCYTGRGEAVFGVVRGGRTGGVPGAEEMVGLLINTVPLRVPLPPGARVIDWLDALGDQVAALLPHEHASIPDIRRWAGLAHGSPLFDTLLDYQPRPFDAALAARGGAWEDRRLHVHRRTGFPLSVAVTGGMPLRLRADYDAGRFDAPAVDRMLAHLARLLGEIVAEPGRRLGELDPMDADERHRVLHAWAVASPVRPEHESIVPGFEAQAARTPDAVAVMAAGGGQALTYAMLNARANRLARHLRGLGVAADARVAIWAERSPEMVVAMLAVLKAGGAYVPLDPGDPDERVAYLAGASGARLAVAEERLRERLPAGLALVPIEADHAGESGADLMEVPDPRALAYVVFTSGTTGRPKPVGVPHGALANHMAWMQRAYPLAADDRVLQKTPAGFDASVWEFHAPLLAGATLVLAPAGAHRDPAELLRAVRAAGATVLQLVPSVLRAVLDEAAGTEPVPALRRLFCGGEELPAALAARAAEVFRARVVNLYGPTEACIDASAHDFAGTVAGSTVPIGRPVDGMRALVLDRAGRPVPTGVAGALYLGGAQLARGYLGRPGLTAASFVPDPFGGLPGARLYHTGDRARWRSDGVLEYLGRLDEQIKVRGVRVEPGEVEAALREHPSVHACAVAARDDGAGVRLVAYVVGDVRSETLRSHLRQRLPDALVPSVFVSLDELPRTPNGKLDRSALPAPSAAAAHPAEFVAPRTPVEELLAAVWSQVLGVPRVGAGDDFFQLGGHSLLATRAVSRIRQMFGVQLGVGALFDAPTLAGLAARVEEARGEGRQAPPPVVPAGERGSLPLSFAQERLWFEGRLAPGSAVYNVPSAHRLRGPLNVVALQRSLGEIVRRHEVLRTRFPEVDGAPVRRVDEPGEVPLPVTECAGPDDAAREADAWRRMAREAARPFALATEPPYRARLLRLGDQDKVLVLTLHHVATDGWSTAVMFRELEALYGSFCTGREAGLPDPPVQYADFAAWQREQIRGEGLQRDLSYWKGRLAGAPTLLSLPTDRPRPPVQSYRGAVHRFTLPAGLAERLEAMGRGEGATLYMVLLAAFQVLLSRYAGQEQVVVGSPVANRPRPELESLVGVFVNTIAVRTDLGGDPGFLEVLRRVRTAALGAYEHQDVPFEKLVEELQPERSLGHNPLFQAFFALHGGGEGLALPGLRAEPVPVDTATAKFDVSLHLTRGAGGLSGVIEYATDLFDSATAARMAGHLGVLLGAAAADAARPISRLSMIAAGERERLLEASGSGASFAVESALHQRFEAVAAAHADAPAVTFDGESLTYGQLNERANRLAAYLRRRAVGPEVRVAICLDRGLDMIVSILAVLKAGGAYVPLDPRYPAERLSYMVADSGVSVVLGREESRGALPERKGVEVMGLDREAGEIAEESGADLGVKVDARNLAYVIYTSGSTGRPKGVGVTHGNVQRLFLSTDESFGFGSGDVWTLFHSYAFDFSVWEIWGALLYGGRLVIVPGEVTRDAESFRELLAREKVTVLSQTPSAFRALSHADEREAEPLESLRTVVFGGEALQYESLRGWLDRYGPRRPRLVNMYGITETTVHVTYHALTGAELRQGGRGSGVGGPIADLRTYVLDGAGQPAPAGVPGELYVGGAGLARGYLGRPGLTAERFVPDPFSGQAGARLYRSGDLARWRPSAETRASDGDGDHGALVLEYLGRIDQQVKVRGFRIELGEIESVLLAQPGVSAAAVVTRGDGDETALVAYVVGESASPAALRDALRKGLPEYMVPAAIVLLDRLPLTSNGKLDRGALPEPDTGARESGGGYAAPRTPVEEMLAGIWAEVLGRERVGARDDFFELGGHSLLATRVVSRVREVFGLDVPLRVLFEAPTVAGLAERIEGLQRVGRPGPSQAGREGPLPLSFAQERLWFEGRLAPGSTVYNVPSAHRLRGPLDVAALQRALGEIVRRHEVLRTRYAEVDGAPVQRVDEPGEVPLPVTQCAGPDAAAREADARRRMTLEAARPFDLAAEPPFRAGLLRLGDEDHVLLLTMHHIATDGWSTGVLFRELEALYASFCAGRKAGFADLPLQYADFAAWQREQIRGEALERDLSYWKARLAGAPTLLSLPTDRPRPAIQSYRGAAHRFTLPPGLAERLEALARREKATLHMVLLGAFQVLLHKYAGQEQVVVGSPVANRPRLEFENLIGFFVDTIALRTDLSGDPSFRAVVARVRDATLEAYEHQGLPFDKLVGALQPERSLGHNPLFQAFFALHGAGQGLALPRLRVESVPVEVATAKFDVSLHLTRGAAGLSGLIEYATDLFDSATAARMAGHLCVLLGAAAEDAARPISRLSIIAADERERLLEASGAGGSFAVQGALHQQFEEQATRTPRAAAVTFGDDSLSYAALNERANRLARRLQRMGVRPEERVGLCAARSVELVVGILAILKAGGAYVPLDPAYPDARLAYMAADSEIRVLLAGAGLGVGVGTALQVIALDDDPTEESGADLGVEVDARNLAYVIYTSGSTGRPKGVGVTHGNVQRLFLSTNESFGFGSGDVWTLFHSYAFDFSVWEIWGALLYGGRLVVVPAEVTRDAESFRELLARESVTVLSQTPSAFRALSRADERCPEPLESLRTVVFGGEALQYESLRGWLDRYGPKRPRLVNMYGITETTVHVTYHALTGAELRQGGSGVGGPIADLRTYVLDSAGQPVPEGVPGELYVGGAGLARGYLGRPGLTAERFVPDPFSGHAGARLYRSGDLARWRADGSLEYMGRIDQQVKVRGFRIELGEIESVLLGQSGVSAAAVVVRGEGDEASLVAYVVGDASPAVLRDALRKGLPEYMVPGAIVMLDRLPLTSNGKLDRAALPEPDAGARESGGGYAAPRTPVEEMLAGIWAEVLGRERIGVGDDFFELGGHSLLATRVVSRVREVFGLEVPLRALFEAPTVAGLAERIEGLRRAGRPGLPSAGREGPLPLSFAQERLWFLDRMDPGNPSYNHPLALRLRGALNVAALERALGEIVRRHEVLRTRFQEVDGSAAQIVAPWTAFALPVEELPEPGAAESAEAAALRRAAEEAARPLDLEAGPLFRAVLLRLSAEEHVLVLSMHHIVTDGWSTGVLLRELGALYGAYRAGGESPLPEPQVQYADYAVWQREQLGGEALERDLAYWKTRLEGAPQLLELPADHLRPATRTHGGAEEPLSLSAQLVARLEALGRREGATLHMVLLAAFQVLLGRYASTDDVVVGSPIAGRTRREVEDLIGFFVNTLVLRTDLSGDPAFREVLRRVREVTLGAYEHQDLPFERLVEELQPERSLGHSPLFQVMFTLGHEGEDQEGTLPGLRMEPVATAMETTKFDLTLALGGAEGGLRGVLAYSTDLFERGTIERMGRHLERVLEQVVEDADLPLSRLELMDAEERRLVLEEWNRTEAAYPSDQCIHQLFEAQAERTPDAVALVLEDQRLTYGELDERANRLARHLRRKGVRGETRVAVCLERGPEMVVSILAILKAGGAYVPLDPAYPAERLAFMLDDSAAKVTLTQAKLRDRLPGRPGIQVVSVDDAAEEIAHESGDRLDGGAAPRSLAYVIYTSGSTGRPKGVGVEHRSVVRLVRGANYAAFGPGEVILQGAPISFDASTLELWGALLNGGRLALMPGSSPSLEELGRALRQHEVTTLWLTAGLFQVMVQERLEDLSGIRQLLAGGDILPVEQVRKVRRELPGCRLVNGYGPTENTTFTCCYTVPEGWSGDALPIGRPISNTRAYVLDAEFRPVPVMIPGELYAGGAGVARGYLGHPALTAERFVPDRFSGEVGARLYRTGDRARWRPDGTLDYLGRLDEQVKIRGFRIEPGEVDAALRRLPGVADCAVVVREDEPGEKRLVAYVVGGATGEELRGALRGALPEYMVPAVFVPLPSIPLTSNGKVDRRALPAPDPESGDAGRDAPRTPVEEVLAEVWAQVLGRGRVGIHDGFFQLGGHSLLAMRVGSRVRELFGVDLPLRALFEAPTVAGLAEQVEARRLARRPRLPAVVPVPRDGPLPLSFAQERLWFLDRMQPGGTSYNVLSALRLRGVLDRRVLEGAVGELVQRHESLRTTFGEVHGAPVQVVAPFLGFGLEVEDISGPHAEEEARHRTAREAAHPFDLGAGPLFRARLLRLGADDHVLLVSMHHIVSDGWSLGILFREMETLYAALREGGEAVLPELPVQYADYAAWQHGMVAGNQLDGQVDWWRERLAGVPTLLSLPTDRPRPAIQSYRGAVHRFTLPDGLAERLEALARGEGATLYMVLLAAFQVLLSRYAGQEQVVVGSPVANRPRPEVEGLVGFFVDTVALRTDLSGDPSFRAVVARVREATLEAYEHQNVPFEKLVEELQPERSLGHNPLFQAFFALHGAGDGLVLPGLRVEPVAVDTATAKFDVSLHLTRGPAGLSGGIEYATDLFDSATAARMADHLGVLLGAAAEDAARPISRLPMIAAAERERLLGMSSGSGASFAVESALHQRFEAVAAAHADAPAVTFGSESLTYRELNERANRLARRLRRAGVGPEERVGLCAARSVELVVGIVAILKAGGAYVPLDPAYPDARLAYMAADSGIRVLLAGAGLGVGVGTALEVIALDDDPTEESGADLGVTVDARNLAYVIYTSGSTGRPKGVGVTHANVQRLFLSTDESFGFGSGDVWTLFHSYAFDFSVWEIWGALLYGGRLVVVPAEVTRDAESFRELLARERVTVLSQTPSAFRALSRADERETERLESLRTVVFGGEALQYESLRGWLDRYGPRRPRLVNMYGITETTVHVTYHALTGAELRQGGSGVGGPIADLRTYVLDAAGQPAPVGIPGELYVGGAGLARGYLGRPGLTAERFVPDPFSGQAGARLYRSGDLARWRADGSLEYMGRIDQQVKVRGFRIELGEIESLVLVQPGVSAAAVVVRGEGDETALVAYVVGDVSPGVLRDALRKGLPEYMVPGSIVMLDRLPLTSNGKLDRAALPEPDADARESGGGYAAPRTPVEEILAGIWAEVLGRERVGARDDFFELGGHSLLATRVVSRVREVFGLEVPLRALFEAPSVAGLADRVEELRRADHPRLPPVVAIGREAGPLPLSFAQERLWFLDRMDPGNPSYNHPLALRLDGALDVPALERALGEIVRRHQVLRTRFQAVDGSAVQIVTPWTAVPLPVEELPEEAAPRRVAEEAAQPFDLEAGPLFRAVLLRLGAEEHVLVLSMHHIVTDGWSTGVLLREMGALYGAYRLGGESPLPEPQVQYADYAVWQREQLRGEALERDLSYWKTRLAGAPQLLELPADHLRPAVRTHGGAHERLSLSAKLVERLEALGRREGATLYMVLLAAFQVLLGRYGGTDDVVVGSPIAGRTRREVEDLIGFFVNTLVLRTDLSGDPAFRDVLRRVREVTLGAYEHQDLPFERLVEELQPERSLGHSPLFQVMFTLGHEGEDPEGTLAGLRMQPVATPMETTKFDLTLALGGAEGGLRGVLAHSTDLFEQGTIERMGRHLERVLEQVVEDAELPLSALDLMDAQERGLVLGEWNLTEAPYPSEQCIHQLFAAQAERTPGAVAVVFEDQSLTYRELDERANRLANHLRHKGVRAETRVAVCLERGPEMVISILAILKAGGAYVPLDPAYPAERLAFMLGDSAAKVTLTQEKLRGGLPSSPGLEVVSVDGAREDIARASAARVESGASPLNLAYVIYTSGSTGRPKGVGVDHAGMSSYLAWAGRTYPAHSTVVHSSLSFDLTVTGLWVPLLAGGRVELVGEDEGIEGLAARLENGAARGTLKVTPAHLRVLGEQLEEKVIRGGPECLVVGGEALLGEHLEFWKRRLPGTLLVNEYGPTETVVGCCIHVERLDAAGAGRIPIGRPVANTRLYVLDDALRPLPVGIPGELYIGGAQMARGYLGRPGLTAERFVPDPFASRPGGRLYRTGDRVRWRADGVLDYLGRLDEQVKIRGFRVEPGEIEAVLRRHPGVIECAIVAREDVPGEKRLVAYVVGDADGEALRPHLRRSVPEYMLPSAFVRLDALPLTPNGKLEHRALPAPVDAGGERRLKPETEMEARIAGVWQELLGLNALGVEDNFFDLGGHSLLLVRMQARLARELGCQVALVELFQYPTVRSLVGRLQGQSPGAPEESAVTEGEGRGEARQAALGRRLEARLRRAR